MDGNSTSNVEKWNFPILVFFKDSRVALKLDELGREILSIALPVTMALAADPIASLIDTIYIGRIGPVEIAAVGISIALFNQVSKVAIFPLVSITTSFVAEEDTIKKINMKAMEIENTKIDVAIKDVTEEETPQIAPLENSRNDLAENNQKESPIQDDGNQRNGIY